MSLIDAQPLEVTCSSCSHQFTQPVGDVKRDGQTICPGCGHTAKLDEAGAKQIALAEKELVDLQAHARNVFKNLFKGGK